MSKKSERQQVNGGWIRRDAATGRFVEAGTEKSRSRLTQRSEATVKEASSLRSAALKRLADR